MRCLIIWECRSICRRRRRRRRRKVKGEGEHGHVVIMKNNTWTQELMNLKITKKVMER
jgi:hypothetical protein